MKTHYIFGNETIKKALKAILTYWKEIGKYEKQLHAGSSLVQHHGMRNRRNYSAHKLFRACGNRDNTGLRKVIMKMYFKKGLQS